MMIDEYGGLVMGRLVLGEKPIPVSQFCPKSHVLFWRLEVCSPLMADERKYNYV
jgi:hypothetical protein